MTDTERSALYSELAMRLRRTRKEQGWSQQQLAKRVSVSRASIVNIENGRQRPPLHVVWEIADALGKEVVDLIPRKADLSIPSERLSPELAREVKKAANGDQRTIQQLTRFIEAANSEVSSEK